MPKRKELLRVEAHLMPDKYDVLKSLAENDHRTIKNYVEIILLKHIEENKKAIKKH